ncbi:MAG TPA: hypothetical protein VFF41_00945 [Gallionella sp.]|nr:hypothetical protein [Gallionella sp.]
MTANDVCNHHSLASQVVVTHSQVHNFVAVELSRHVPYSAVMAPKSLLEHNPHLHNAQEYQRALRASVLSSIAIEGVRKAAERALTPKRNKQPTKTR